MKSMRRLRLLARLRRFARDQRGATTLEWTLLFTAIAVPSWLIIELALDLLTAYYRLALVLLSMPTP